MSIVALYIGLYYVTDGECRHEYFKAMLIHLTQRGALVSDIHPEQLLTPGDFEHWSEACLQRLQVSGDLQQISGILLKRYALLDVSLQRMFHLVLNRCTSRNAALAQNYYEISRRAWTLVIAEVGI